MFQLLNRLAGFKAHCYEFFTAAKYSNMVRSLLFWVVKKRVVIISYGRLGSTYRSRLRMSGIQNVFDSWILMMGPIFYRETSVRNYHCSLRNNLAEGSYHLSRNGSLKSSTQSSCFDISLLNLYYENFNYTSRWHSHCTVAMRKLWSAVHCTIRNACSDMLHNSPSI
jgi:hypothetical protein